MRRLSLSILLLCALTTFTFGQKDIHITFELNIATLGATNLDTSGLFVAGGTAFGFPGDHLMTDIGGGIYSVTITIPQGTSSYYTFLNGNCSTWTCKENISGLPCADPVNFNDRYLPYVTKDTTIKACFGECLSDGSCSTTTINTSTNGLVVNKNLFTLQPTIVNNYTTIQFADNTTSKQITVVNAVGQVMISTNINNTNQYQIDATNFTNGLYFITVRTNESKLTKKIMVIR